jgi:cytochrome P450
MATLDHSVESKRLDLEDYELWTGPSERLDETFSALRRSNEHTFTKERDALGRLHGGYWSVFRHADIVDVSRRPEDFSSAYGVNIVTLPPGLLEFFGSIITKDGQPHHRIRRIVGKAFSPRSIGTLTDDVEAVAAEVVADVAERGEIDFVHEVAALLPLRVILDMMGIPRSQERFVLEMSDLIVGGTDPDVVPDQTPRGQRAAFQHAQESMTALIEDLVKARRADPKDDLVTLLIHRGVDGESLTPHELASFFTLLVSAGNETTRQSIAHGMLALTQNPEQRQLWQSDFDTYAGTAVEEILRWASPVAHMRRTVTKDGVRIGDREFREGEKIVMWYYSANRDEDVFDRPDVFDIKRRPNNHLAFGGPGVHFCLGAHLARRELAVTFREIFRQLPDLHITGEPKRLRGNFIRGIKYLPATFTPSKGQRLR